MTFAKLSFASVSLAFALAGCGASSEPANGSTPAQNEADTTERAIAAVAPSHSEWAGKWVGVEGTYVDIKQTTPGTYTLEMQSDLDTEGSYTGQDAEGGIVFQRGGENLLLRAATGDETGLKYLAGKQDCLMVDPGEGYCRAY